MKTIIIAGGSGFLGQVLEKYFTNKRYIVRILTRNPKKENDLFWDSKNLGSWTDSLENIEAIINLTGKSVDCRYTKRNKKLIYNSRIESTNIIGKAINLCKIPPRIWINSSTATIYKHSLTTEMDEGNGEIGNDFSMNIAKSWESAFYNVTNAKTRKIIIRTAIVLGKKGGALIPLKNLTKIGLGGKQGLGNQKVSWIHELDFARAIDFLINNQNLSGNFNLSVPKPTNNETLMKSLRKSLKIRIGINQPIWLLKLGAKIIGTETELILKSRNVIPKRLLENGYSFKFTEITKTLNNLINN